MPSRILFNLLEVLIGAIVGYLTYIVSYDNDKTVVGVLSIIVGLLSSILSSILINGHDQGKKIDFLTARLNKIIEVFASGMEVKGHLQKLLKHGSTNYARQDTDRIWLDILWNTTKRYWATSYSHPSEVWHTKLSHAVLAIQSTKIKVQNVDIRRVYLIDSAQELVELEKELQAQIETGVKIKYMYKSQIEAEPLLASKLAKFDSVDFGLSDSIIIWFLHLNRDRKIRSGQVIVDDIKCSEYEEFYKLLFDASETYKPQLKW